MSAVEQLLAREGLLDGFRREGRRLFGPCPVHRGDNPRAFVVDLLGDRWYCFSQCRRGGGPVALARALGAPTSGGSERPEAAPERPFVPYVRALRLDPDSDWLARKGIWPSIARAREVGLWHGTGMLADCVGLRLHDLDGAPLGYAGRRLDPQAAASRGKWTFPRGLPKSRLLYGRHHVFGRRVVLTECPWGVLRLAQLGIDAVALLGVGLSPTQTRHLEGFEHVVVLMDGDAAGRAAGEAAKVRLGDRARVALLPYGADPDDLGDNDLAELVRP